MRKILHTYKLRLTNLSQANRSLRLAKLSRRRDIDLKELDFVAAKSSEEILLSILSGKDVVLVDRLDPRNAATNSAARRLNNIYREVNTIFEETGAYDLYLGYPFVEGKFLDETTARCPVALFPVRLERDLRARPRWKLTSLSDEPVLLNRTFFLAYERFQQLRLPPELWETELERNKDWRSWLNNLYELVKQHEIEVNFNARLFDLTLNHAPDFKADTMANWPLGKLTFQSQAVLGIFPRSDSALLQDYEALESMEDTKGFNLDIFFPEKELAPTQNTELNTQNKIREEDRYFVTKVDESQEEALLKVQNGASLALHGPPGTGKSQVIVNLIANAMAHDKRVLLVSQKRAALDVVHKRLESLGLGRFAALVHDHRHDRKAIFAQLRRQLEDLDQFRAELRDLNFTQWEHHYRQISRQVDQLSRSFDDLHEALSTRSEHGLSPHELYVQCEVDDPLVPLGQEARQLTQTRLVRLLDKLESLYDYRELFEPAYPWADRLSFHAWGFDERTAIEQLLEGISEACASIDKTRSKLGKALPELSDSPAVNRELLGRFSHVRGLLGNAMLRDDVEAILRESMRPSTVKKHLDGFEAEIEALGDLRLFKGFPWGRFDEVEKHLQVYHKTQKKAFRLLSLDYLRARWFLKKWLEGKGEKLSPTTFKALQGDFKSLKKVQRRFGKLYQHDFFHDFPLLDSLEEKARWLDRKRIHFEALGRLNEDGLGSLKPEFDHGHLIEKKWEKQQRLAQELEDYNRRLYELTGAWARFLSKDQIKKLFQIIHEPGKLTSAVSELLTTLRQDFGDMQQADSLLANFDGTELGVWEKVQAHAEKLPPEAKARREAIRQSVLFYWLQQAEQEKPVLATVSGRGFHRQQEQFAHHVEERRTRVTELVSRRVKEQILERIEYNRLGNPVTFRDIQHQVSKQRRLWSVRRLVKESWDEGLDKLLPCWMCSPETASAIFPLQPDFFDLVIFDEASQCFVERGLPVLLRGKQWLVAGDHMQLQPFDLYTVRYEEEEAELTDYDAALEVESILDLARQRMEEARLTWHYRSRDAALINFSNHAFYDGRLQVVPPAKKDPVHQPAIIWKSVEGLWKNNRNEAEADEVVQLVEQLLKRETPPSIGVVTFNYHQQELIKDKLDQRLAELADSDAAAYAALQRAMLPPPSEADNGLFVKNIENVQGDERDIIIFSIAYAPNEAGKLNTHFGLLSQRSGENRLNVAISRARLQAFVLCSFRPEELNVGDSTHPGPRLLQRFLQYARAISDDKETEAERLLETTGSQSGLSLPNPLAEEVASALESQGYQVVRELGDTAFKLDLAIQSADGDYMLGISCEGPHYFGGRSAKAREVYRRALLTERGWKLHHVWARNWRESMEKELEKMISML